MRYGLTALVAVLLTGVFTSPASADMADCPRGVERAYAKLYKKVAKAHGKRAPGRNIRSDGVLYRKVKFRAVCSELRRSTRQLRKLTRAPLVMHSAPVPPGQPPGGVQSDFNVASLPSCTWVPESATTGLYDAYNPASRARGKYQVIPSTHDAICPDLGWSHQDQETCAARIWREQGAGAWVNC